MLPFQPSVIPITQDDIQELPQYCDYAKIVSEKQKQLLSTVEQRSPVMTPAERREKLMGIKPSGSGSYVVFTNTRINASTHRKPKRKTVHFREGDCCSRRRPSQ